MWGTIREGLAVIILVLSLDAYKIRCRCSRTSLEMVVWAGKMLFQNEELGFSRDFARPHRKL